MKNSIVILSVVFLALAAPGQSMEAKIEGHVVSVSLPYSDIGGSSGQTIRLAIRECDGPYNADSFFPEVLLTLK